VFGTNNNLNQNLGTPLLGFGSLYSNPNNQPQPFFSIHPNLLSSPQSFYSPAPLNSLNSSSNASFFGNQPTGLFGMANSIHNNLPFTHSSQQSFMAGGFNKSASFGFSSSSPNHQFGGGLFSQPTEKNQVFLKSVSDGSPLQNQP